MSQIIQRGVYFSHCFRVNHFRLLSGLALNSSSFDELTVKQLRPELEYLFSGIAFYTRLAIPARLSSSPNHLNKSRKYLPRIGLLVGAIGALTYSLSMLVLPEPISVLLSMIATVFITGAFHEDGFADSCDGFGGGWKKEQILRIMKDSCIGTYGAIGLLLSLGLKYQLLLALHQVSPDVVVLALLAGHAVSRLMASVVMQCSVYVADLEKSKSSSVTSIRLSALEMLYSVIPVVILWLLVPASWLGALVSVLVVSLLLSHYFKKKIGGYTGDCLGAVQQVSELTFYLSVVALA